MANKNALLPAINMIYIYFTIMTTPLFIDDKINTANITNI